MLDAAVGPTTRVVGVTAHDPYGLSPVSMKLTMLFGGGPTWNASYLQELGVILSHLRARYPIRVIAGGPGIWQMSRGRPEWVDTVFQGEAEVDFPNVVRAILAGASVPSTVQGRSAKVEEIPPILKPARVGEAQVTRGCPRGCEFCSITPEKYRTFPLEIIQREIAVNLTSGERSVELLTDDILLYGAKKLHPDHEAVIRLFTAVKKMGAEQIYFPHVSAPAVKEAPETILEIGEIAQYDRFPGESPVVCLETGSTRIFAKYMPAKAFPWKPADWSDVILDATQIMNQAHIWPCYTMTIGFPDETDHDVDDSIRLIERIVAQDLKAWIFPLPVIPISTSRLKGNPFPILERLPSRYWDLLEIAWQRDLKLARELTPTVTSRMKSAVARRIIQFFVDRLTQSVGAIFRDLRQTHGRKSYEFSHVDLNSSFGAVRSIYWATRASLAA